MRPRIGCRQPIFCALPSHARRQGVHDEPEQQPAAFETLPASTTLRMLPGDRLKAPVADAVAPVVMPLIYELRRTVLAVRNAQSSLGLVKRQACNWELGGTTV